MSAFFVIRQTRMRTSTEVKQNNLNVLYKYLAKGGQDSKGEKYYNSFLFSAMRWKPWFSIAMLFSLIYIYQNIFTNIYWTVSCIQQETTSVKMDSTKVRFVETNVKPKVVFLNRSKEKQLEYGQSGKRYMCNQKKQQQNNCLEVVCR